MFNEKVSSRFTQIASDSFKNDYYRSIWYLFLATGGILLIAILQLVPSVIFACRARAKKVLPKDTL